MVNVVEESVRNSYFALHSNFKVGDSIVLRPIEDVEDEDIIAAASLLTGYALDSNTKIIREIDRIIVDVYDDFGLKAVFYFNGRFSYQNWSDNIYYTNESSAYDYLRFKGYTLPYMNISVTEMQKKGWLKQNPKRI